MKRLLLFLIPFIFLACEKDYKKIAEEDNLSGENKVFLEACEKNDDIYSCNELYFAYLHGEGAVKDREKAQIYRAKTCDLGYKLLKSFGSMQEYEQWRESKGNYKIDYPSAISKACWHSASYYYDRKELGFSGSLEKLLEYSRKECDLQCGLFPCVFLVGAYRKRDANAVDTKEYKKLWLKQYMTLNIVAEFSDAEGEMPHF